MEAWRALLDAVRADAPAIASLFDHGVPLEVSRARVLVGFERGSFLAIQASEADTVEALRQKVRARFGPDTVVALDVSLKPGSVAAQPTIATVDAEARAKSVEDARAAVLAHPLVAKAVRVLGAEVKDIKLAP
jgi:DNA polymerase-3 subunit gamma/tau